MSELIARFVTFAISPDLLTPGPRPTLLNALVESGYGNHLALVFMACAYLVLAVYIIRRACPELRIWP